MGEAVLPISLQNSTRRVSFFSNISTWNEGSRLGKDSFSSSVETEDWSHLIFLQRTIPRLHFSLEKHHMGSQVSERNRSSTRAISLLRALVLLREMHIMYMQMRVLCVRQIGMKKIRTFQVQVSQRKRLLLQ